MVESVEVNECFARDGLQHEERFLATTAKVELIGAFVRAGFRRIEATSYSSPKRVPAFSDASDLLSQLPRPSGVSFKATCPNERAVERALDDLRRGYGADEVSLLCSASDSHSRVNLRASRDEQWRRLRTMAELARGRFTMVGVVSVAFGCPFEGRVPDETVLADVERFRDLGASIVTIGDTTGLADPRSVSRLFERLHREHGDFPVVAHFHDTRGAGLANALAAYDAGCRRFDAAMGGIGGHPAHIQYGTGQTGNVATEDLVNMFESMGVHTGLDLAELANASRACEAVLGRRLNSQVARAGFAADVLARSTNEVPV